MQKRFSISFGTIFSLIIVYFIFLYANDRTSIGWRILAFISKWYLIIFISIIALGILIFLIISLILLIFFIYAKISSNTKKHKEDNVYDASYQVKGRKKEKLKL